MFANGNKKGALKDHSRHSNLQQPQKKISSGYIKPKQSR